MSLFPSFAWLQWNPSREAFTLPFFDITVAWYGVIFAAGFVAGYFLFIPIFKEFICRQNAFYVKEGNQAQARQFADHLTWFIVIGTVVGARLGHVFFYDWPYMQHHLLEIFMIRNGGLASHGGTVGVLLGIWLFLCWNKKKYPGLTFIGLVDLLCIPTGLVVAFIRIGNFFNQEILGIETRTALGGDF